MVGEEIKVRPRAGGVAFRQLPVPVHTSGGDIDAARLKSSFHRGVSRLGKSIRPLLTDDDAPRRAMDELKIKSETRKWMSSRSNRNAGWMI